MADDADVDATLKILLVGDSGVGKSSLLQRFVQDSFSDHLPATIGIDFMCKTIRVYGKTIKLLIWDSAGQEKFRALTSSFCRGAAGVIFVYDVTAEKTLASVQDYWLSELQQYASSSGPVCMLVGNKVDKGDEREVTWAQGIETAKANGCLFVEASAKSGAAVSTAFEELVLKIIEGPALTLGQHQQHQERVHMNGAQRTQAGSASSCMC